MDVRTVFRNLVTNEYMPDFDYSNHKFSFHTVFFRSSYHYCCCPCAFEHEFMDYLSDTGDINEEIYDRVVANIVNGECLHVVLANQEYVTETGLFAIHIATAVGTYEAVKIASKNSYINSLRRGYQGGMARRGIIFKQSPLSMAVLKNNVESVDSCYKSRINPSLQSEFSRVRIFYESPFGFNFKRFNLVYTSRQYENQNGLNIEQLSEVEHCVLTNNPRMLKTILNPEFNYLCMGLIKALELTFPFKTSSEMQMQTDILFSLQNQVGGMEFLQHAIKSAIVYDRPFVLDKHLNSFLQKASLSELGGINDMMLTELCHLLQRNECQDILNKYREKVLRKYDKYIIGNRIGCCRLCLQKECLLFLLEFFFEEFSEDIAKVIELLHSIHGSKLEIANRTGNTKSKESQNLCPRRSHGTSLLKVYIGRKGYKSDVVKFLIDSGVGFATTHNLYSVLSHGPNPVQSRKTIELLIYENVNEDLQGKAVDLGIKADNESFEYYIRMSSCHILMKSLPAHYEMDMLEHGIFGHDGDDIALNLTAPLLIESGFPVSDNDLIKALDKSLPKAEHEYFRQFLNRPRLRPLMLSCRDSLRKHFKGRKLHSYVGNTEMPGNIRDFILLKPLLKCLHNMS